MNAKSKMLARSMATAVLLSGGLPVNQISPEQSMPRHADQRCVINSET